MSSHELVARGLAERRHVPVGHDHEVAVVVRKLVEDDVAGDAAEDDERGFFTRQRLAEHAASLATVRVT